MCVVNSTATKHSDCFVSKDTSDRVNDAVTTQISQMSNQFGTKHSEKMFAPLEFKFLQRHISRVNRASN